jgi:anti-sigma-K factor RskA
MSAARGWPLSPAAVALDALDPDERAQSERLLAEDPTFRAEVERLRGTTAALTALDRTAWEPVPPPPLRSDIIDNPQERGSARVIPLRRAVQGRRRLLLAASGLAAAAVAAAAALAIALVTATNGGDDDRPGGGGTTIALKPLNNTPGRASLTIAGSEATLTGRGLPPSGAHDYYEAWLADARGRMVSMGTFRVSEDGRVDAHMAVAVKLSDYRLVDVSLEPDDGDPGHSDTSVLRADL